MNSIQFSIRPIAAVLLWNLPVIIAGLITSRWQVLRGISGMIIQVIGLYLALVIAVETLLGFAGFLSYAYVLLFFILLLLIIVLLSPKSIWIFKENLKTWFLSLRKFFNQVQKKSPLFLGFIVPIFLIFSALTLNKLFSPPTHVDCLFGLLPQVFGWLRTNNLLEHSSPVAYFHHGGTLITLWAALPFGNDFALNLQNIPAIFLSTNTNLLKGVILRSGRCDEGSQLGSGRDPSQAKPKNGFAAQDDT